MALDLQQMPKLVPVVSLLRLSPSEKGITTSLSSRISSAIKRYVNTY